MKINQFTGFFSSTWSMTDGGFRNCKHWIQIITAIPEILSTDHSHSQTTDKRIIPLDSDNK